MTAFRESSGFPSSGWIGRPILQLNAGQGNSLNGRTPRAPGSGLPGQGYFGDRVAEAGDDFERVARDLYKLRDYSPNSIGVSRTSQKFCLLASLVLPSANFARIH